MELSVVSPPPGIDSPGMPVPTWVRWSWRLLIWLPGIAPAAMALVLPRLFSADAVSEASSLVYGDSSIATWLARSFIAGGLAIAGFAILFSIRNSRIPRTGLGLWLGVVAYSSASLLSSVGGLVPYFTPNQLAIPLFFTAAYVLPPVSLDWFLGQVRSVFLVYTYGSLIGAVFAPGHTLQQGVQVIPGIDFRLHGIAAHANHLGPFLLTYLILDWLRPSRRPVARVHHVVVLMALVLTQNKTSWIVLVAAYAIRAAVAAWQQGTLVRYMTLVAGFIATSVTWLLLSFTRFFGLFSDFVYDYNLDSLSGRTAVWERTVQMWSLNPWLGYGPSLWNMKMGLAYVGVFGFVVTEAHGQFFQTLGEAGIVGAGGLLLYGVALMTHAVQLPVATKGVGVALVASLILRGVTEYSLRSSPIDGFFYVHFISFSVLLILARVRQVSPPGRMTGTSRGVQP